MIWNYEQLWVCHLTQEQHSRTCDYWYIVTSGATAHTAFKTLLGLYGWLDLVGLSLPNDLGDAPDFMRAEGEYARAYEQTHAEVIANHKGDLFLCLDNGRYTEGVRAVDDAGIVTLWVPNCNDKARPEFDYRQSKLRIDAGRTDTHNLQMA